MLKAVILIGGPQKGTRFRPLSFDLPKPLFPVAGKPMVQHLIEACARLPEMKEIYLIGFYQLDELLSNFINALSRELSHKGIILRYLQEYTALGTAGGIYHFRDQIRRGQPEAFFVLNGDVCGDFRLDEVLQFHRTLPTSNLITMMTTDATRQQSLDFGCIVESKDSHEITHYVEKPSTFVSEKINCGVYCCSPALFQQIALVYQRRLEQNGHPLNGSGGDVDSMSGLSDDIATTPTDLPPEDLYLETDILTPLAGTGVLHSCHTMRWWSQIKTAGSAIYANRYYLQVYREKEPQLLAHSESGPTIIGDVYIHPSAVVDPTSVIGPNVSISEGVKIGPGVRIRESIVLRDATIHDHSLVLHSIVGWNCMIGAWARIEGTPCDPNPDKAFAKLDNKPLFNGDGKLNPSITVLGFNVHVYSESILLNSIVLPHKELTRSYKNEIIL